MVDALPTPDRRKYGSKLNQPPEEFEIELVYFLKDMVIIVMIDLRESSCNLCP